MDESRPDNTPEYGVADLAGAIRRTLEGAFGRLRLRGQGARHLAQRFLVLVIVNQCEIAREFQAHALPLRH